MRVVLTFLAPGQTRMKVDESCFDFPCSWLNKDES